MIETARQRIERLTETGQASQAFAALGAFWRENPWPAAARFVLSKFAQLRPALAVTSCKLAILRSFTVEPVVPLLRAGAAVSGIDLVVQVGEFNTYAQEILDPASRFYGFAPDVLVLAVQSRDIAPDLWTDFSRMAPQEVSAAVERVCQSYSHWVETCRSRSQCHIVIHNLETPFRPANGIFDWQQDGGQSAAFRQINFHLAKLPGSFPGVYVLDYEGLVAEIGREAWQDERNWASARLPISAHCLTRLASEWLRFLHPLMGRVCKVLALDLDNTLWGGVIGEDGMAGIQLGDDYPGAAYRNLQRAILDLTHRGVLLAICSKNNAADAMEALEKHPQMILRPSHFAAVRINWNEKAQNLREVAAELNLGLDAIAFLDDNPAERNWVRSQAPEVTVIDLPDDPIDYARALREAPVLERLTLSSEDHNRGRYYAEQRLRGDLQKSATSVEEFLSSLEIQVDIVPVSCETVTRVAQLTQKTNQFNLTTRRYSEQQIRTMVADPAWRVDAVTARDRFGDNGIVGVVITHISGAQHEINEFLLSCRVIGRTIETAILSFLVCRARREGGLKLVGEFLATKKNTPAGDFYSSHGFRCIVEQEGFSRWELDLEGSGIASPQWLDVRVHARTNP